MASYIRGFLGGLAIGFVGTWTCDEMLLNDIYYLFGHDRSRKQDYLTISTNITLEEKRMQFKVLLEERGASFRLIKMISESNIEIFQLVANNKHLNHILELKIMEKYFRTYYPELFDNNSGLEFIKSLNLKTKCNDHDIPQLLRNR